MSAIYMSQISTTLPLIEGDHHQDHHQGHFKAFTLPKDHPILFPFVISNSNPSDNNLSYGSDHHLRQHQAMLEPQHMIGGGSSSVFATPFSTVESIRDDMIERSSYDLYGIEKLQATSGSVGTREWRAPAAAKMKITRKTSDPGVGGGAAKKPRRRAQAYEDHNHGSGMNQPLGVIRMCSDCNTTKTPLWRSGPCGPKSLCNACGIRQRKARRAMMASGASADGAKAAAPGDAAATLPKVKKGKRSPDVDRSLPFKKRCKVVQDHTAAAATATGAVAVESAESVVTAVPTKDDLADSAIGVNWSKSSAAAAACFWSSSPAFAAAQDEITDAAMLLMTMSCGLVRS